MLDSRPRGHEFEPHQRHCIVSLSKNINPSSVLVQPRKTRPCITERHAGISPIYFFFRYLACVNLEPIYVYLANCVHDLASNTEVDSKNHKMKVMLTPKFRWDVKYQNKHV